MGSFIPLLIFVAIALLSGSAKKKTREATQQAQRRTAAALDEMDRSIPRRYMTAAPQERESVPRPQRAQHTPAALSLETPATTMRTQSAFAPVTHSVQTQGSLDYSSSEGEASGDSFEGSSAYGDAAPVRPSIENGSGHVVHASFESNHAHVESSATGFVECPPEREQDENYSLPVERKAVMPSLGFGREDMRRAILYSEIFSKPRALRR